jgi:hypothetical protein
MNVTCYYKQFTSKSYYHCILFSLSLIKPLRLKKKREGDRERSGKIENVLRKNYCAGCPESPKTLKRQVVTI